MSKYDPVLRADFTPPGVVDNKGGMILDGRMLMTGSVGADKISIKELSDLIVAMGTLRTGTIHLGQSERSFLRLTSEPVPRLELRDPQGRYVTVLDANPSNGVTVAMGLPDANGVHPFRIPVGGDVEIRTRAIVGMNSTARTFIDAGMIDLLATGTTSWDAAGATGLRLKADWGIASKRAGTETAKWDAELGEFIFAGGKGRINEYGAYYRLSTDEYAAFMVARSEDTNPWSSPISYYYVNRAASNAYTQADLMSRYLGSSSYAQGRLHLYAEAVIDDDATYTGDIYIISGRSAKTVGLYRHPGIYLVPQAGYPVTVIGSLIATGEITGSSTVSGELGLRYTRHAITEAARTLLPVGAVSVVEDATTGAFYLCINTLDDDYFRVEMTKVAA